MTIEEQIRDISTRLLDDGSVDVVIGYGQGTLPGAATPVFITSSDDVDRLSWGVGCTQNLARYVQKRFGTSKSRKDASPERIGVVAKKCDARALVELIRERQVVRENLFVIGVPCNGMLDRAKLRRAVGNKEILTLEVDGAEVRVKGKNFDLTLNREELLRDNCIVCQKPDELPLVDEMLQAEGDYEKPYVEDDFSDVKEYESLSPKERWERFRSEFAHCIRCYACRNACPFCYCSECFAESSQPRWLGPSVEVKDLLFFQIVRIIHQAGRCVDCGACTAACPMGLNIRQYTRKLNRDSVALFQFEAGANEEGSSLLDSYSPEDTQNFMTEPE